MKLGFILPSVLVLPSDVSRFVADGVEILNVTLNNRNGLPGEAERALANLPQAANVLVDEGAQAIVVMGVPVAARRGFVLDGIALDALTAERGAVPIVSSLKASVRALKHLGVRRPLFVTQYDEPLNLAIRRYAESDGLEPAGCFGLDAKNSREVNALSDADFGRLATDGMAIHGDADAIFLSARASMLNLAIALEAKFAIPVIEQTQASMWWLLDRVGLQSPFRQTRLFQAGAARAA